MDKVIFMFHGLRIQVESENRELLDRLALYHDFLSYRTEIACIDEIDISIDTSTQFEDNFLGTQIVNENNILTRCTGKKMSVLVIDPVKNIVSVQLPSMQDHVIEGVFESVFMQPLKYLMKKYGIFFMHASSVALDGDHGIVFIGDQHAGKSTMALTLLMNGYFYIAEESPAISIREGAPVLYGFPEPIGVSENSLVNFPELRQYCGTTTAPFLKHRIKFDTISPGKTLSECKPCAVIFPQYRSDGPLEFIELNGVDTLKELISLELVVYEDDFNRPLTKKHMHALGTLAQSVRSYRLLYNDCHLADIPGQITRRILS